MRTVETGMSTADTGHTMLVVDDEPFNIDVLTQELEDIGHRAVPAANGREALALIDEIGCDLVLLDIMMPEMDGIEVLTRLSEAGRLASLPVIVVSAVDDVASVARCLELGAEDFLLKPFDPTLLRARINGALEKKRLRDQVDRQLETIRKIFGKYVPESVAETILAVDGALAPAESLATILYCDIEGFTGIVERMAPARTMEMLNAYFAAVLGPVRENGGTVNQFLGDAMLVTFNVPVGDPRHGDNALRTAIGIHEILGERCFAGLPLRARIGINTGPVVAGNIEAGGRLHYTVIGDTVNVAARLEALNKAHGTDLLISGATVAILQDQYALEKLGDVPICGKKDTVTVYRRTVAASSLLAT
jgi:adenylate cyclase